MEDHTQKRAIPVPAPVAIGMAKERMITVIAKNKQVISAAEKVLVFLNENPECDADFCLLFGIQPQPAGR